MKFWLVIILFILEVSFFPEKNTPNSVYLYFPCFECSYSQPLTASVDKYTLHGFSQLVWLYHVKKFLNQWAHYLARSRRCFETLIVHLTVTSIFCPIFYAVKTVLIHNSRKKKKDLQVTIYTKICQILPQLLYKCVGICIAFNVYKGESRIQKRKRNTTNIKRKKNHYTNSSRE